MNKNNIEENKYIYDKYVAHYHTIALRNVYRYKAITIDKWIDYCKEKDVLDIGCGTGVVEKELYPFCKSILGDDISPISIEFAKKYVNSDNVQFICGDVYELQSIVKKLTM